MDEFKRTKSLYNYLTKYRGKMPLGMLHFSFVKQCINRYSSVVNKLTGRNKDEYNDMIKYLQDTIPIKEDIDIRLNVKYIAHTKPSLTSVNVNNKTYFYYYTTSSIELQKGVTEKGSISRTIRLLVMDANALSRYGKNIYCIELVNTKNNSVVRCNLESYEQKLNDNEVEFDTLTVYYFVNGLSDGIINFGDYNDTITVDTLKRLYE